MIDCEFLLLLILITNINKRKIIYVNCNKLKIKNDYLINLDDTILSMYHLLTFKNLSH